MTSTGRTVSEEIELLWKRCPKDVRPSGSKGHKLLRYLLKSEKLRKADTLENWLLVLDELLYWCVLVTFAMHERFMQKSQKKKIEFGGFLITFGAVLNHALAIRQLCITGFDLPAKQVLRSMIEYAELLMLFEKNPAALEEYRKTDELEYANKFWHAHMSRGKARKALSLTDEDGWWAEERRVLGASVHPSRGACFAAYMASLSEEDSGPGFLGRTSRNSVRTLRVTMVTFMELILHCQSIRFWEPDVPLKFFSYNESNKLQRTAKESWPPITGLLAFVAQNAGDTRFSFDRK